VTYLVDTNVLLYAYNTRSAMHEASRAWLDEALSAGDRVGFAWLALVGFVRLATNPRVSAEPASVQEATDQVTDWITQPSATVLQPTSRHSEIFANLLGGVGVGGNLVNDAHVAALAVEHKAEVVTFDTDFARFPGVRWRQPA
jgi:uncharacterized protein